MAAVFLEVVTSAASVIHNMRLETSPNGRQRRNGKDMRTATAKYLKVINKKDEADL
jgi:hypothetical protein